MSTATEQAPPRTSMLVRLIYLICTAIGVALVAMFAAEARGVSWDLFTTLSYIQPQCHSLTGQCPAYARRPVLTVSALTSTALFDKPRAALLDAYSSNAAVDHTTVPAFVAEQVVNQSIIDDLLDLGIPAVHDCHDDFIDVVDEVADRMVNLTGFQGRYFAEELRVMYLSDLIMNTPIPPAPPAPTTEKSNVDPHTEGRPGLHAAAANAGHQKYPTLPAFRRVASVVMFLTSNTEKAKDSVALTVGEGKATTAHAKPGRALVVFGVHPFTEVVDDRAWIRSFDHVDSDNNVVVAVVHVRQTSWMETLNRVHNMQALGVPVPYPQLDKKDSERVDNEDAKMDDLSKYVEDDDGDDDGDDDDDDDDDYDDDDDEEEDENEDYEDLDDDNWENDEADEEDGDNEGEEEGNDDEEVGEEIEDVDEGEDEVPESDIKETGE